VVLDPELNCIEADWNKNHYCHKL